MKRPIASQQEHLVCTIIAPNYLDKFLILGRSMVESMPRASLRVLVLQDCADISKIQERIDSYLHEMGADSEHVAITIDEVDWGDFDVESAALFYSTLEFATSVKPAFLRSLVGEGWQRVTYLDPDIQVFNDFTSQLDDHFDLSLTPHFLTDIPRDGLKPSTYDILAAGLFNLGFCSVRPSSSPFLDWWAQQLQFDCVIDHQAGRFTDQKILDLAPLKARVQMLKDPGLNVAYWNLHERRIVLHQGQWSVSYDGSIRPLFFFHFSGFRTNRNPSISVHATRKVLGEALPRAFANQYERQLLHPEHTSEEGRSPGPRRPKLGSSTEGVPYEFTLGGISLAHTLPPSWRRQLRTDCDVHVRAGCTLREVRETIYNPRITDTWLECRSCGVEHHNFGTRVQSFLAGWACHSSIVGVPNAISAFFQDAKHEFRAPAIEQLAWASDHLAETVKGVDPLIAKVLLTAGRSIQNAVNLKLIGYFSYPAGVGQIARWTLRILESNGIFPAVDRVFVGDDSFDYLSTLLRRDNPMAASNASVLCFVNADQWDLHITSAQRINPATEYVEAVWAWELEHITGTMFHVAAIGDVARIHALSRWSTRAMSKVLPIPVQRFAPFDLELIDFATTLSESSAESESPSRYILTTFDAKSYLSRKNPEAVLELWRRVQADYPDHSLVIKSADLRDFAPAELLDQIDGSDRTVLIDKYLDDRAYIDLLARCDVFLSLHRSEGMGLTPIEAGLLGIPVVYTNYGGVSEFMEGGFFPVSYAMTQVSESKHETGHYDAMAFWAEPDLDDAEIQLHRAMTAAQSEITTTSMILDQKQLQENLTTAVAEVVDTAQRLLDRVWLDEDLPDLRLGEQLLIPRVFPEVEPPIGPPNPIVFGVVAVIWRIYKTFPRSIRQQINLALYRLRGRSDVE